jgi:hypothetical protein
MGIFNRRTFLATLGAGAAALFVPRAWDRLLHPAPSPAARLAALYPDRASAAEFGRLYLERHPEEAHAPRLLAQIAAAVPGGMAAIERMSDEQLRAHFDRVVTDDFGAERIEILDGWVLAVTEVRLCALATLAP